jgi:tetratricopeptide (TPR) repeat protein
MTAFRTLLICTAALLLVGAAPGPDPEEAIREANAAVLQREYDRAQKLYDQAEVRATDPGLVAFNKAVALYRLGGGALPAAEASLRRALEDAAAPPARRARALYNLGTTLVQIARDSDAAALAEAVQRFRECLRLSDDPELRASAAHNLELARLLWLKARASGSSNEPKRDRPDEPPPRKQPEDDPHHGQQPGDQGTQKGRPAGKGQAWLQDPSKGQQKAVETQDQVAGRGNQRPLPDEQDLQPLDPQESADHLRLAVERIMKAQRDARRLVPRSVQGVKDW